MFKKTFLAVSVGAALVSAGAQATPSFEFTQGVWTNQAQVGVEDFCVPDIEFSLGTEYTDNDTITITFSQDVDGDFATSLTGTEAVADGFDDMKLGLLSSTSNSATYRVVTLVPAQDVNGVDLPLVTTGASFTLTSTNGAIADGNDCGLTTANAGDGSGLTAEYQAVAQGGAPLDGTESPVDVVDPGVDGDIDTADDNLINFYAFSDQFAAAAAPANTGFSKVIDVDAGAASKAVFTAAPLSEDNIVVSITDTAAGHGAQITSIEITVSGDFSWIVDQVPATAVVDQTALSVGALVNADAAEVVVTASDLTVTYDQSVVGTGITLGDVTISLDNTANDDADGNDNEIEDATYTVSTVISYAPVADDYIDLNNDSDADDVATYSTTTSDEDAIAGVGGGFSYNGSVVDVYAMPTSFAKNLPFIWITNSGAEEGEVFAVATTEDGTTVDMGEIGTIGGTEIKSFSTAVQDAITAEGITTGRVTLELTTSVPACDVNVSAQYYNISSMDRAALETSQTIGNVYATDADSRDADRCNL